MHYDRSRLAAQLNAAKCGGRALINLGKTADSDPASRLEHLKLSYQCGIVSTYRDRSLITFGQ